MRPATAARHVLITLATTWLFLSPTHARTPEAAARLIARFHMQPVPAEGGWFAQLLRTDETIDGSALPARYNKIRHPISTAILYVETATGFSAIHRLKTDEVWHFYSGDPVHILLLTPDGHGREVTLDAQTPALVVPHNTWQGSAPAGPRGWSFVGTTMAPGFIPEDFEPGKRASLTQDYPEFQHQIAALTRTEATRP
ncbi:cupin domain-containing protein [Acetobacter fallax]|uniref:Cupin domain-containing protein n=1 Tax=Acetobacter fallax TaxID=1737473 RepID=A0ABX0K480_9PROT|nr:cupin domain-containing protein [Acetobacter fallax]NHO31180.1 cupin domain-containing protein [Acetobacter fallax]NHO34737.1 cupin domain-containing protein [Acetobacter fallax]